MRKSIVSVLTLVLLCAVASHADARRRRRRRRKKKAEPQYTITGRVRASIDYKTRTKVHRRLNRFKRFKGRAYWRFYDPLAVIMKRVPLSKRLVVVVTGVKAGAKKNPEAEEVRVKGGGIFPELIVQHLSTDLTVYNSQKKKVSIFSPGRVVEKRELKPEIIRPQSDAVFNISPREHETSNKDVHFWSYPLRLKEFPAAKARVVFVRSPYFATVTDTGLYTIEDLPAGKYKMLFIYVDKVIKEVPITVKKKRKRRGRRSRVQYMKTVKLSLPLLKTY